MDAQTIQTFVSNHNLITDIITVFTQCVTLVTTITQCITLVTLDYAEFTLTLTPILLRHGIKERQTSKCGENHIVTALAGHCKHYIQFIPTLAFQIGAYICHEYVQSDVDFDEEFLRVYQALQLLESGSTSQSLTLLRKIVADHRHGFLQHLPNY